TWQNAWTAATSEGSGAFTATTSTLQPGLHILYAFSTDGQDADSSMANLQQDKVISEIVASPFVVTPPPTLIITASGGSFTYGGTVPAITPGYSGFVNGDTSTNLTTQPTCSTTATSSSPAGSYPSSCTGAADPNYTISYVAGNVTVGRASLSITASSSTTAYGVAIPAVTAAYSGFVNGDT